MMKILFLPLIFAFITEALFAQKADFNFQMDMYQNKKIMTIVTTKSFACSNFGIIMRQGWSRDTLTLRIVGIDSRQNCNNVVDIAQEVVLLRGVQPGTFHLKFEYEQKSNFFLVEFDGSSFTVMVEKSDFISYVTF